MLRRETRQHGDTYAPPVTLESIAALVNKNEITLNAFINYPNKYNSMVTTKLNSIQSLVKVVEDRSARLTKL